MGNHIPYQPDEEELQWMSNAWYVDATAGKVYSKRSGDELGTLDEGRIHLIRSHLNTTHKFKRAHVIWWNVTGKWPTQLIDHENRNSQDDRFVNLKLSSSRANVVNSDKCDRDLPTGVYRSMQSKTYHAKAFINGKTKYLGSYNDPGSASRAYQKAISHV